MKSDLGSPKVRFIGGSWDTLCCSICCVLIPLEPTKKQNHRGAPEKMKVKEIDEGGTGGARNSEVVGETWWGDGGAQ